MRSKGLLWKNSVGNYVSDLRYKRRDIMITGPIWYHLINIPYEWVHIRWQEYKYQRRMRKDNV